MARARSQGLGVKHVLVNWVTIRSDFKIYLQSKRFSEDYMGSLLRYGDKYLQDNLIAEPMDILRLFAGVKHGVRHLWLTFRAIFNYLESVGFVDSAALVSYHKALPQPPQFVDFKVPSEQAIIDSMVKLRVNCPHPEYIALYNLLIDSGVRLIEAVKAIELIESAEKVGGFYRICLGLVRGCKSSFYVYLSSETYREIIKLENRQLNKRRATDYYRGRGSCRVTSPKYLRKFAFDKMLELGIAESIADFYQGRVPRTVGARHYANLVRLSDKAYPKYLRYLGKLKGKVKA